jgi:hypothetical protein
VHRDNVVAGAPSEVPLPTLLRGYGRLIDLLEEAVLVRPSGR